MSTRSDSVKKELPKRNVRSNRKYCSSVEKDEIKTDTEKSKSERIRRSKRFSKEFNEIEKTNDLDSKEKKDCDENLTDSESEKNDTESGSVSKTRKPELRYSTESDPKTEELEKNTAETDEKIDIKSETGTENENKENVEIKEKTQRDNEIDSKTEIAEETGNKHLAAEIIKSDISSDAKDNLEVENKAKLEVGYIKEENDDGNSEVKKEVDEKSDLKANSEDEIKIKEEEHEVCKKFCFFFNSTYIGFKAF